MSPYSSSTPPSALLNQFCRPPKIPVRPPSPSALSVPRRPSHQSTPTLTAPSQDSQQTFRPAPPHVPASRGNVSLGRQLRGLGTLVSLFGFGLSSLSILCSLLLPPFKSSKYSSILSPSLSRRSAADSIFPPTQSPVHFPSPRPAFSQCHATVTQDPDPGPESRAPPPRSLSRKLPLDGTGVAGRETAGIWDTGTSPTCITRETLRGWKRAALELA